MRKAFFRFVRHALFFAFLTLLTQTGGLVWLVSVFLNRLIQQRYPVRGLRWLIFIVFYTLSTIFLVPPIARHYFGRVPLPAFDNPHLSHRDGKKVDITFYWKDAKSGAPILKNPSPHGYGLWAAPLPGEFDYARHCIDKGYWYVGLDADLADWTYDKNDYLFDAARTRELLRLLAEHPSIGKILIQPHLKKRLDLEGCGKIRAQGCHAARHDDHAHVQL